MKISVIIPAHNEQKYIGQCIDSIREAGAYCKQELEIIVVLNRCDDKTGEIALSKGAKTVVEDARSIAKVRNAGAFAATGDIIATIDADSIMTKGILLEIYEVLMSKKYVGGGAKIRFERYSAGIWVTDIFVRTLLFFTGLYSGIFWCFREDFLKIGGFTEEIVMGEDLDFAKRLKAYGKKKGLKYGQLKNGHMVTSCRKFDRYGDWVILRHLFKEAKRIRACMKNKDRSFADEFFYDFEHER